MLAASECAETVLSGTSPVLLNGKQVNMVKKKISWRISYDIQKKSKHVKFNKNNFSDLIRMECLFENVSNHSKKEFSRFVVSIKFKAFTVCPSCGLDQRFIFPTEK